MAIEGPTNAIYFPEGAGYLLVKVLQSKCDNDEIESNVMLVKSLDDNKLYIRKSVELSGNSFTGIPNEIEFNPSFGLIPRVKDITKYVDSPSGDYSWAVYTEFCNGGDLRSLCSSYVGGEATRIHEALLWKFMADFIKILAFLGSEGIEHRDIWPQNIFLRYSDENPDDNLPDFVLGDFGWAVALEDENSTADMFLFCSRLHEMCCYPNNDRPETSDSDRIDHWLDLRRRVQDMLQLAMSDLLSIDTLLHEHLHHAEKMARVLYNQVPLKRHLSKLPPAPWTYNANKWPEKLACVADDWQLVQVKKLPDGSGKLSIQGVPRTRLDGKRSLPAFLCSTSGPIDLHDVYLFDACKTREPPRKTIWDCPLAFLGLPHSDEAVKRLFEVECLLDPDHDLDADEKHDGKKRKLNPSQALPLKPIFCKVPVVSDEDSKTDEDDKHTHKTKKPKPPTKKTQPTRPSPFRKELVSIQDEEDAQNDDESVKRAIEACKVMAERAAVAALEAAELSKAIALSVKEVRATEVVVRHAGHSPLLPQQVVTRVSGLEKAAWRVTVACVLSIAIALALNLV